MGNTAARQRLKAQDFAYISRNTAFLSRDVSLKTFFLTIYPLDHFLWRLCRTTTPSWWRGALMARWNPRWKWRPSWRSENDRLNGSIVPGHTLMSGSGMSQLWRFFWFPCNCRCWTCEIPIFKKLKSLPLSNWKEFKKIFRLAFPERPEDKLDLLAAKVENACFVNGGKRFLLSFFIL